MPSLTLGTTTIWYIVEPRPRRRYPAIQVDAQRQVRVLVPLKFPRREIVPLLKRHGDWIVKHVTAPPREPSLPQKQFVTGEKFSLQGEGLVLEVATLSGKTSAVTQNGGNLCVTVPPSIAEEDGSPAVRELLIDWFYRQAVQALPKRIAYYSPQVGVDVTRLKIWEYKSRWGFCRDDGLIALNWRIIQAPRFIIDYVVVHELTHRRHPHHQAAFWDGVKAVLPDYEISKQWLKTHGAELVW